MSYTNYLDMYDILVNQVAGNPILFLGLMTLLIVFMGAKLRFPDIVTVGMLSIFLLLMGVFFPVVMILVIFILAIIVTWGILRIISGNK